MKCLEPACSRVRSCLTGAWESPRNVSTIPNCRGNPSVASAGVKEAAASVYSSKGAGNNSVSLTYELIGYVFLVVGALIPIANPFSTAPVFVTLTAGFSREERHRTATRACTYMAFLLLAFLLTGALILEFFGISLEALRVAGGLIIAYMGFRMLFPPDPAEQTASARAVDAKSIAFMPLALPMLSGPGSISVVISMATEVAQLETAVDQLIAYSVVGLGIVLSAVLCWLVLYSAGAVVRFLGDTGIDALTRLMGFLLVCIGCQFVLSSFQL